MQELVNITDGSSGGGLTGVAAAVRLRAGAEARWKRPKVRRAGHHADQPVHAVQHHRGRQKFPLSRGFAELKGLLKEVGGYHGPGREDIHRNIWAGWTGWWCARAGVISPLCGVEKNGDTIIALPPPPRLVCWCSPHVYRCTGDADLARMAGCPHQLGPEGVQPMTLCFASAMWISPLSAAS